MYEVTIVVDGQTAAHRMVTNILQAACYDQVTGFTAEIEEA